MQGKKVNETGMYSKGLESLPKVSIIIPVYNAEKYIEKCLQSVIRQTYNNLEIIIVNDGSKDSSKIICDQFQRLDKRIAVINNDENRGVGFSRNCGIRAADGDYIIFVDCDDIIDNNYVEELLKSVAIDKFDLAICRLADVYINDEEKIIKKNYRETPENLTGDFLLDYHKLKPETVYLCGPAVKIYKKDIIDRQQIFFPEDLNWGEDQAFNQKYYKFITTFVFLNTTCYYYCHRPSGSLNQRYDFKNFEERLLGIKRIKCFLEKTNVKEKGKVLGDHCFQIINDLVKLDDKSDGFQDYKKRLHLLKDIVQKEWKGSSWKRNIVFFCIDHNVFFPVYVYFRLKRIFTKI